MTHIIITFGMLLGGLGLFLLAVSMITDGLRQAAGHALRDVLGKWTRTPARGLLAGSIITAIVQSSSAVTVATIGFVNAGLLNLYQALGVVFGSNVGTTVTAWLVAVAGFKLNIESFALPMIGIGMILRLIGSDNRTAYFGMALAGFGLFFIGIDVLKEAFEGVTSAVALDTITLDGFISVVMFVGIGFLMTLLTQSSSAAIALTLTATTGGVIGLYAAAAMVIGSNLGTTSTAAMATIGATPNAKRVAAAHIIFNLVTGVIALSILPGLIWVVQNTGEMLGLADVPALTLALFHTLFNILGVLLMFPLIDVLTHFLSRRFVSREELESKPKFLDRTVLVTPVLALNALSLEMARIISQVKDICLAAVNVERVNIRQIERDRMIVDSLNEEVADFITSLEKGEMSEEVAEQLTNVLRSEQHVVACVSIANELALAKQTLPMLDDPDSEKAMNAFRAEVVKLLKMADPGREGFSLAECELQLEYIETQYDDLKQLLLHSAAQRRVNIAHVIVILEQISHMRDLARRMVKAVRYLSRLSMVADVREGSERVADNAVSDDGQAPSITAQDTI